MTTNNLPTCADCGTVPPALFSDEHGTTRCGPCHLRQAARVPVPGISLKGYLETTYGRLLELFGRPKGDIDPDKEHLCWEIQTPHGEAIVYDYGDCHECDGEWCTRDPRNYPDNELVEWHIGGLNRGSAEWIIRVAGCEPIEVSPYPGSKPRLHGKHVCGPTCEVA